MQVEGWFLKSQKWAMFFFCQHFTEIRLYPLLDTQNLWIYIFLINMLNITHRMKHFFSFVFLTNAFWKLFLFFQYKILYYIWIISAMNMD